MKNNNCPWYINIPPEEEKETEQQQPVQEQIPVMPAIYGNVCPWHFNVPRYITYPGVMPNMYTITSDGIIYNVVRGFVVARFFGEYITCNLMRVDGSQWHYGVHRLVAWEWVLENRDARLVVNHKDGNKHNPNYYNLEWVTPMENVHHAMRTGLTPEHPNQGENHGMAVLTDEDVHKICKMLENPRISHPEILEAIGNKVDMQTLLNIANGRRWTHISKLYNIKPRCQLGQLSPNAKLTDDMVHQICKMLEDPYVSYEEIVDHFGGIFTKYTLMDITKGKTWRQISCQYKIPKRSLKGLHAGVKHNKAILTEEDVHKICKALQDPTKRYEDIAREAVDNKVTKDTIFQIAKGKQWPHISSQYKIPPRNTRKKNK